VRISSPVAVKIGKLEWNKLRKLPDFKGERAAPPPIYAPEQGRRRAATFEYFIAVQRRKPSSVKSQ
jgi:hypothetical protein